MNSSDHILLHGDTCTACILCITYHNDKECIDLFYMCMDANETK